MANLNSAASPLQAGAKVQAGVTVEERPFEGRVTCSNEIGF